MKNIKIKCIIFDFGKVIGNFNHMTICQKLTYFSKLSVEEIYKKIFNEGLEKEYDEGLSFVSFSEKVRMAIGAGKNFTAKIFMPIWGDIFSENPDAKSMLAQIKPGIKILLLSNTNEVHWRYISQIPAVKKFFNNENNLVLSFKLGFRKPDERIFLEAIKKTGCKPEEIIYIDDIPEYIETFKKLGGNGIQYDCAKDPVEKLEKNLSKFNVLR